MATETPTPELLHAQTQVGYLMLKLKAEGVLSPAETRKALQTLFPTLIGAV